MASQQWNETHGCPTLFILSRSIITGAQGQSILYYAVRIERGDFENWRATQDSMPQQAIDR
jgi:hypothetical protein